MVRRLRVIENVSDHIFDQLSLYNFEVVCLDFEHFATMGFHLVLAEAVAINRLISIGANHFSIDLLLG